MATRRMIRPIPPNKSVAGKSTKILITYSVDAVPIVNHPLVTSITWLSGFKFISVFARPPSFAKGKITGVVYIRKGKTIPTIFPTSEYNEPIGIRNSPNEMPRSIVTKRPTGKSNANQDKVKLSQKTIKTATINRERTARSNKIFAIAFAINASGGTFNLINTSLPELKPFCGA